MEELARVATTEGAEEDEANEDNGEGEFSGDGRYDEDVLPSAEVLVVKCTDVVEKGELSE